MSDTKDKFDVTAEKAGQTHNAKLVYKHGVPVIQRNPTPTDEIPFSEPTEDQREAEKVRESSDIPPWRRRSQKRPDEIGDDDPITLSFRMTGKDLKRLNSITQYLAISKSDFFREAIIKLLEQEESFVAGELRRTRVESDRPF